MPSSSIASLGLTAGLENDVLVLLAITRLANGIQAEKARVEDGKYTNKKGALTLCFAFYS